MHRSRSILVAAAALASVTLPASASRADSDLWPQLSYSMAIGRSQRSLLAHLWAGAGAHVAVADLPGLFVLGGAAADFRDAATPPHRHASAAKMPRAADSAHELWLSVRVGVGIFASRALAPKAALYVITGRRVAGPSYAPTARLALGASAPLAVDPLAYLGIPTMIEAGADVGGAYRSPRWFCRLGWNF